MPLRRELDQVLFESTVQFYVLRTITVNKLIGETPNVLNAEFFKADDDVTVTNFLNGSPGQRLHILGNGTKVIQNNTNIITNTGSDVTMTANQVYRFTYFPDVLPHSIDAVGKWYQDA